MRKLIIFVALSFIQEFSMGQSKPFVTHPNQLENDSFAEWIGPQDSEVGVFYFRKLINLDVVPETFVVHVSADNRYRLYVNGEMVSWGPAVGDLSNWNYETVDISNYLTKGKNVIASQVWNLGSLKGSRQISHQTAFILQGNSESEHIVNTDDSWKFSKDEGYEGIAMDSKTVGGGYIAGGTDRVDATKHPWGWNLISFDHSQWSDAKELGKGNHGGLDTWKGTAWNLTKRDIPVMLQKREQIQNILEVTGASFMMSEYKGSLQMVIPANSKVDILLDNKVLTMGFPQLVIDEGTGSTIKIQYQESLYETDGTYGNKGNRDHWKGKEVKGYYDYFISDGGDRQFQPLWIRVFRYVKLTIETKDEPLKIKDFYNIYTAYPFEQKATFSSNNKSLKDIWDVSWRTAQLCALETYMDCPYYEQLQYIGDTRIQGLISYYVAGDERLIKNAIRQLYGSMQPMGLTKSNHPAGGIQIIPPFSLKFIDMVHDYHMLGQDSVFVKEFLPGMRFILDWFIGRIESNGILGPLPYWNHIDGGTEFINGSPPGISEGGSAHMSILLAYAIERAVNIFDHFDYDCDTDKLKNISKSLKENTYKWCYDAEKGLISETPDQNSFSQHTNSFAILTGVFSTLEEKEVAKKIISDTSLIQTSLYFDFYVFQALKKVGFGGDIPGLMKKWEKFLEFGLTTFPEHGLNSRSDCHAWSAHPMFDFLNIICGIESTSPGFKSVEIRPQPGILTHVSASVPHPLGEIKVSFKRNKKDNLIYEIMMPEHLKGVLIYNNKKYELAAGSNKSVAK